MLNLFVDANVLLGFYGLPPRDLEELRKLLALVREGDLVLWVPDMLRDEYERNRPKVLAEASKALKESRLKVSLPEISAGIPERDALEEAVKEAQRKHSALLDALSIKIMRRTLEADAVIADLLAAGNFIETGDFVRLARDRRDLRRPPGKSDSLGDAVNWETLLDAVPHGEDIHIVSGDRDFRSPVQDFGMHEYLADEWKKKKGGTAHLYQDLGSFTQEHFTALRLADDLPKLKAVKELATSGSFADTHVIVARLAAYDVFNPEQADLLIRAAAENSQVRWIATDPDVYELLQRVIQAHRDHLDSAVLSVLEQAMHPPTIELEPGDDLPL